MSNVASARVDALNGDPVKGMMLELLESAALTEVGARPKCAR